MGITSAVFQEIGKMSDLNVAFMIDVDGDKMAGKQSLITRIGIVSVPGALPLAIDMMTFLYLNHVSLGASHSVPLIAQFHC